MIALSLIVVILAAVSVFLYIENINRKREIDELNDGLVDMMTKYLEIWRELSNN